MGPVPSIKYNKIIRLQAVIKGFNYRKNNMPNSIKILKSILEHSKNNTHISNDGRLNSCFDESIIIDNIKSHIQPYRLYIPKIRHWFDIAILDYMYGWLPINIKSTTTTTSDNSSGLAMCVYALTNFEMNIYHSYQNGKMSSVLINCLKNKKINRILKRDYYFLVNNKTNNNIIINSLKGLSHLTPNINNLPFQIKWNVNTHFIYNHINKIIDMVRDAIIKPKPSWKEIFLREMRIKQ